MMLKVVIGALLCSAAVNAQAVVPRDFYNGCGETKQCLGEPVNCLADQSCTLASSFVKRGTLYDFEIFAEYELVDDGRNWVATAFSRDVRMWNDTVLFCSAAKGAELYWNIKQFSILVENQAGITQNGEILLGDGAIYCSVTREEKLVFMTPSHPSAPSTEETNDLAAEPFFWMLASGPLLEDDTPNEHVVYGLSDAAVNFYGKRPSDFYAGCGVDKVCYGTPKNCLNFQNCTIASSYIQNEDTSFDFEIYASWDTVDDGRGWVATGFSRDQRMWNDTILFCSPPGGAELYWNIHDYTLDVENYTGIALIDEVLSTDGALYCKVRRDAKLEFVTPSHASQASINETNDLAHESFVWMLSTGHLEPDVIFPQEHDVFDLTASVVNFVQNPRNMFYTGCGTTKTCFGSPGDNCIANKNCTLGSSYVKRGDLFDFEIFSSRPDVDDDNSWVATAFSRDVRMWNDTVLFCSPPNGAELYWNVKQFSLAVGDNTGILQNGPILSQDGSLYCAVTREARLFFITPPHVSQPPHEETNDLTIEPFYWMLASGPLLADDTPDQHDVNAITAEAHDFGVSKGEPGNASVHGPAFMVVYISVIFQLWYFLSCRSS